MFFWATGAYLLLECRSLLHAAWETIKKNARLPFCQSNFDCILE